MNVLRQNGGWIPCGEEYGVDNAHDQSHTLNHATSHTCQHNMNPGTWQ